MTFKGDYLETQFREVTSISSCFNSIKKQDRIALMPFLMAGDPNLATTSEILLRLQDEGADIIELGIPYSDPLADGPVIQASAARALNKGTTPGKVFEMLSGLKGRLSSPVILFTYSNPLLSRGIELFCEEAASSGVAGLVVPDLPLEEAELLSPVASGSGLDLVLLVAPTTPKERMKRISLKSRGFTYLVSVTGVTGERAVLADCVKKQVKQLKETSPNPVAVGFGISGAEQVQQVRSWGADGAIVGSAFVKRISEASLGSVVDEAGIFCRKLREAAG